MGFEVIITRFPDGVPAQVETFEQALYVTTSKEGHLDVVGSFNGADMTIAVYAPGSWLSAQRIGQRKAVEDSGHD